jgi:hypothetical protein
MVMSLDFDVFFSYAGKLLFDSSNDFSDPNDFVDRVVGSSLSVLIDNDCSLNIFILSLLNFVNSLSSFVVRYYFDISYSSSLTVLLMFSFHIAYPSGRPIAVKSHESRQDMWEQNSKWAFSVGMKPVWAFLGPPEGQPYSSHS